MEAEAIRSGFKAWCEYTGEDYSICEGKRFAILVEATADMRVMGACDTLEEAVDAASEAKREWESISGMTALAFALDLEATDSNNSLRELGERVEYYLTDAKAASGWMPKLDEFVAAGQRALF